MTDEDDDKTQTVIQSVPLTIPDNMTAYLVVLASEESTGKMFRLEPGEHIIGRAPDATIRLEGPGISRHHARLVCLPDGTVDLEDLGSKNGTFVQGEPLEGPRKLRDGDKLQIGNATILKLSYQDSLDQAFQETLYESATRDGLTGAFNKKYFGDAIQRELSFCVRHQSPLSLVMVDVDFFKRLNDTHGHLAGDQVLSQLGLLMGQMIRAEDVLARVGGEEFAFLLRECNHPNALNFAERVRAMVEATPFTFGEQQVQVTVSVGVATLGRSHPTPELLLEAADRALYRAKEQGRNRVASAEQ
jgi:two-component system cell cycle response regulator